MIYDLGFGIYDLGKQPLPMNCPPHPNPLPLDGGEGGSQRIAVQDHNALLKRLETFHDGISLNQRKSVSIRGLNS